MLRPRLAHTRLLAVVVIALLLGLLAACASPEPPAPPSDDLAQLQQQVETQGTRIAMLETRVALPPPTAAAPAEPTPAPTPTMVPAVAGLPAEGTTKGAPDAPVTIVEFADFL